MIDFANLSPWLWIAAPLVIILSYTVFGLSGFGSTVISVPILAHWLPISFLVPLMVLLDMSSAAMIGGRDRRHVAVPELKRIIPFMFLGFVVGATALVKVPDHYLRPALGMFTMAVAARAVTDWVGDPGAVVEYSVRFTKPVVVPDDETGALLEVEAVVAERLDDESGGGLVRVDLTARSAGEKVLGMARALVRLG